MNEYVRLKKRVEDLEKALEEMKKELAEFKAKKKPGPKPKEDINV